MAGPNNWSGQIVVCTLPEWLDGMPARMQAVLDGTQPPLIGVTIRGKKPDRGWDGRNNGYGWCYGYTWRERADTLPEQIFRFLPQAGRISGRREFAMPLWPSETEALRALDQAAWLFGQAWAHLPLPEED